MTTNTNAALTDEQIDAAFDRMPEGAQGFLKSWGYRQFAREIAALAATPAAGDAESVLIDSTAYDVPAPVAAELLRLNIEAKKAAPAAMQCVECGSCGSAFEVDTYMAGYTAGKGHCLNCPGIDSKATEAAPAAAPVALPEWEKVRRGLTMVMLGFAGRPDCSESAAEAALDAVTEPGMPLAGLRTLLAQATAAPAAVAGPDWWRKRADEIELQVALSGSSDAMRCFTDMRTLLQAATAAQGDALDAQDAAMWRAMIQAGIDGDELFNEAMIAEAQNNPEPKTLDDVRAMVGRVMAARAAKGE
jgi:hypothetical protein